MLRDCHTHNLNSDNGIISIYPGFTDFEKNKCYSCGIHPWKTSFFDDDNLDSLIKYIVNNKICAIGESGIDYLKGASVDTQEKLFIKQIELSEAYNLPMIIHSVKSSSDIIRIKKKINPHQPWIFHGYRGGFLHAKNLIESGFYISIGEYFNPDAIKAIPNDKLLIETDESKLSIEQIANRIKPDTLKISTYNLNNLLNK